METVSATCAGGDRLSHLTEPDCLLHILLSCIGSRQVVQTSLLSRRWSYLWRSVPCVNIDQRQYLVDQPEPEAPDDDDAEADVHACCIAREERRVRDLEQRCKFEDFADAVLPVHGVLLPSPWTRTGCASPTSVSARAPTGGSAAASRAAPRCSTSATPTGLTARFPWFSFPSVAGADAGALTSRLRTLHLSGLRLCSELAEELSDEYCPVLEDVRIVPGEYRFSRIASRSLKSLAMEGCCCCHRDYRASTLSLAAPRLVSLKFDKVQLPVTSEDELPSLAVAPIADDNARELGFLKSLRSARVLELRRFPITLPLDGEPEESREFHRQRTLILIRLWYWRSMPGAEARSSERP